MKTRYLIAFSFLLVASFSLGQNDFLAKQVGLTGLPIIYPSQNSGLGESGINGYALYFSAGKFVSENMALGVRPFIGSVSNSSQKIISAGANAYGRYYIGAKKTRAFIDANIGFGGLWYAHQDDSSISTNKEANGFMFNYAFGPGVDIHLGKDYYFEIMAQYLRMQNISHPNETTVGNTIIPSIGLVRYF